MSDKEKNAATSARRSVRREDVFKKWAIFCGILAFWGAAEVETFAQNAARKFRITSVADSSVDENASESAPETLFDIKERPDGVEIKAKMSSSPRLNGQTSLVVPAKIKGRPVVALGKEAFWGCDELTEITLPDGLKVVGDEAFAQCSQLTEITLPASVESIGESAFFNCVKLENIDVSPENKNFRSVDGVLFSADGKTLVLYPRGKSGRQYAVPNGVERVGEGAFTGCVQLTEIAFPKGLTTIGANAFTMCGRLTKISFSDGLKTIGANAFTMCGQLTELTFPASVETIGDAAFGYCGGLSKVAFPTDLKTIGADAFAACARLTEIALPNGLRTIGPRAFIGCGAAEITLPASVERVGEGAFYDSRNLTSIKTAAGNKNYRSVDGVLFTADGKTLVAYPKNKSGGKYVVPNGVETIGDFAFGVCGQLTEITLPKGLRRVGASAFFGCAQLTKIAFPNSLQTIDKYAFSRCASLTEVSVPKGLRTIDVGAFSRCSPNLTLYGAAGSVAEKHARENKIRFRKR
ncbi:MAG: leucine-rich repeat domain-containing protein [Thermoguttaceae bacterium]|nr:leucine-rich repeat domain-containing protein [Thermoguttaceae bacterium]